MRVVAQKIVNNLAPLNQESPWSYMPLIVRS